MSVRLVNGHTDAMMLPQLSYKGKTVVFMADLLPSVGHVPFLILYGLEGIQSNIS